MGACSQSKPNKDIQQPRQIDLQQNSSQVIAEKYPLPQPKHRMQFPQFLEQIDQIPIVEVTESMAYNFIVRQGVNQQKGTIKEVDYQGVFLFSEKTKTNFFEYGFISIDQSRLDKIIEDKKHYKFLFDFKIVWVFRDYNEKLTSLLNVLKEINVKIKQVHYFKKPLNAFMDNFKMLNEINTINSLYPLLQFDQKDVFDATKRNEDSFRIYLHTDDALNLLIKNNQITLYNNNLQVRNIIFLYQSIEFQEQKKLEDNLIKLNFFSLTDEKTSKINTDVLIKEVLPYLQQLSQMGSNVVLIFSNRESNGLKNARILIEQQMSRGLLIFPEDIQKYNEQLRSLYIKPEPSWIQINKQEVQQEQLQSLPQISREQEIAILYEQWLTTLKAQQLLQSSHNLILRLINNIIDNSTEEKFRTIQKSNKTINLNILQYQEGKQILHLLGFVEGETDYKNVFEIVQLKFARSDLEIAWKKLLEKTLK